MAYYDGWLLANDDDFISRVGFCAETEGSTFDWGVENRYAVASAPGFSDAYATAIINDIPNPGRDPSVISDNQILARVQELLT